MLLKTGSKAPDFTLNDEKGTIVILSSFIGKHHVVLIFYPGDETPGCIKQLCAIRDDYSKFIEKGALVFGVNPAGKESHGHFVEKRRFQFPLLIDEGGAVAKAYGCKGIFMIQRTVYVIDKQGVISFAKRGKPPISEILSAVEH